MRKRLLLSYLVLTVVVVLLLEVPLGLLEARQEHDALAARARRDATALSVIASGVLGDESGYDLGALASRYRAQAGSEVAIMDGRGRVLVAFDPDEANDGSAELAPVMRRALDGEPHTVRRRDEKGAQLVAVLPVRSGAEVVGAVAVAVPAGSTDERILRAWLALALLAVVLLGVAAALGLVLARSLTSPLTQLQDAAERLGDGELSARAPPGGPQEIAMLSEEFNRMADQLAGSVRGQRRFVADASHQLRTPLTSLRLRLENLVDSPGADDFEDQRRTSDIAGCQSEVDRLSRLVDGLLALSRAEGKPSSGATSDVGAVTHDRCQTWAALAEERGIAVRVHGTDGDRPVQVVIDTDRLEQVLDNLLANAVEASPSGSTIVVSMERSDGRIRVRVRDDGPGLGPEDRERAFDRFWQGANGSTGSSGLGLPIVRELLEAAGGTITLSAPTGGGLEATVELRAATPPQV